MGEKGGSAVAAAALNALLYVSEEMPMTARLLIVGHGTRSAAGVDQFAALVERVRRRGARRRVEGGFIELSRPPLTDAVAALVERGHRSLVALPLVLAAAGHGKGDIPAALAREQERHPG